jgi:hypothetical protein
MTCRLLFIGPQRSRLKGLPPEEHVPVRPAVALTRNG